MSTALGRVCILAVALFHFGSYGALAHCTSGMVCSCPECAVLKESTVGRWHTIETQSFCISCAESAAHARSLAKHAEALRTELREKLLGIEDRDAWVPKCQIVLHCDQRGYVSAVGRGSERTVGSSSVKIDGSRIVSRRIDLMGGAPDFLTASFPHELTHVVLNDKFIRAPVPRWADEGLAILADPQEKQGRHTKELQSALQNGASFHTAGLFTLDTYPTGNRVGVFYGQSASVAKFLVKQKSPKDFVDFVQRSGSIGYDAALRTSYNIRNVAELDRQWRRSLLADSKK